ncbi:acyl-CoA thioesterase [Sphingomonas solaris]|nr:thioesterase family protein [Sphingomonas solaris]
MARIDRQRLAAAPLPVVVEIPTRFDDLDTQGHVNNAAATVILQEGRVLFNRAAGLPAMMGRLRTMVASLTIEYVAEMHHPDPVEIGSGILAIGRTSFTIGQCARQNGTPAIFAQAVMVVADETGPVPIPDDLRAAFERLSIA